MGIDGTFQYVEKLNPEMQRYLLCMTDIKQRWDLINKKLNSKGFKDTNHNIESVALQFRMIVELIFLANLSSHEGYYNKLLFELVTMWQIKKIIEEIEEVNKNYYPQSIKIYKKIIPDRPEADGEIHFLSPSTLPKDEILKIYDHCCEFLHPLNPFSKQKDYKAILKSFPIWSKKLKNLLQKHAVQLVDKEMKIFCFIDFDNIGTPDEIQVGFLRKRD